MTPIDCGSGDDIDTEFITSSIFDVRCNVGDFLWRQTLTPANFYRDQFKTDLTDAKLGQSNKFHKFVTSNVEPGKSPVAMFESVGYPPIEIMDRRTAVSAGTAFPEQPKVTQVIANERRGIRVQMRHQHPAQFLFVDLMPTFNLDNDIGGSDMKVTWRGLTFKADRPDFFTCLGAPDGNTFIDDGLVQRGIHCLAEWYKFTDTKLAQQPCAGMIDDRTQDSGSRHQLPYRILAQFAHKIARIWMDSHNSLEVARCENRREVSKPRWLFIDDEACWNLRQLFDVSCPCSREPCSVHGQISSIHELLRQITDTVVSNIHQRYVEFDGCPG